jgi:hypothetical protein
MLEHTTVATRCRICPLLTNTSAESAGHKLHLLPLVLGKRPTTQFELPNNDAALLIHLSQNYHIIHERPDLIPSCSPAEDREADGDTRKRLKQS